LVGKTEGKRTLGRPRRRWENEIKIGLTELKVGKCVRNSTAFYVIHTVHTITTNTPSKLYTKQITFKSKYKAPTCFGTEVPSSGSYS
jgi:hypothetical protein